MDNKTSCATTGTMVMACSGGADVGALADKLARKIAENENTKMFCLAGISAHISGMIDSVKSALKVIVIDGCPVGVR